MTATTRSLISIADLLQLQQSDPCIGPVLQMKQDKFNMTKKTRSGQSDGVKRLLREWKKLEIGEDALLYWVLKDHRQLVLPSVLKDLIYQELHCEMGHLGNDRVYHLAHDRVYWPNMEEDITYFVNRICSCVKRKKPHISP